LPKGFSNYCSSSPSPEREREREGERWFFVVTGVKEKVSKGGGNFRDFGMGEETREKWKGGWKCGNDGEERKKFWPNIFFFRLRLG
jgi:hypothetical protein